MPHLRHSPTAARPSQVGGSGPSSLTGSVLPLGREASFGYARRHCAFRGAIGNDTVYNGTRVETKIGQRIRSSTLRQAGCSPEKRANFFATKSIDPGEDGGEVFFRRAGMRQQTFWRSDRHLFERVTIISCRLRPDPSVAALCDPSTSRGAAGGAEAVCSGKGGLSQVDEAYSLPG